MGLSRPFRDSPLVPFVTFVPLAPLTPLAAHVHFVLLTSLVFVDLRSKWPCTCIVALLDTAVYLCIHVTGPLFCGCFVITTLSLHSL